MGFGKRVARPTQFFFFFLGVTPWLKLAYAYFNGAFTSQGVAHRCFVTAIRPAKVRLFNFMRHVAAKNVAKGLFIYLVNSSGACVPSLLTKHSWQQRNENKCLSIPRIQNGCFSCFHIVVKFGRDEFRSMEIATNIIYFPLAGDFRFPT